MEDANATTELARGGAAAVAVEAETNSERAPILLAQRDLAAFPALAQLVQDLFEACNNEGSASRGIQHIAPNLFIGSERRGFFHYSRHRKVLLVYAYTGPDAYFQSAAQELLAHCERKGYQLNFLSHERITAIGDVPFTATPFGVVQRVGNLREFTLEGGAMRRLRNQLASFQKSGACTVEEFRCGSDAGVAQDIARVIDSWCAGKTKVNPLVRTAREEILAGTLHPRHRLFLTRIDGVLQNVILISPLSAADNGYLMDLEFYGADMPRGGLEFAIVHIIRTLVAEGRALLSLGGTYGCRIEQSPNADAEVDKILDDLHKQNIFNDQGNFQFKNKFRPQNQTIFLCRKAGCGNPDSVIDIIMMIADPTRMQTADTENHTLHASSARAGAGEPAAAAANVRAAAPALKKKLFEVPPAAAGIAALDDPRSQRLSAARFNPLKLAPEHVDFDLKTDSWAQLRLPATETRMRQLRTRLQEPCDVEAALRRVFPFAHFVLTESGRTAEQALYRAWPRRGTVPQNVLFPTNVFHQISNDFEPKELPSAAFFRLEVDADGKADVELDALRALLARDAKAVALVCVELSNNASGGQPIDVAHLAAIRALLEPHGIALVLDATRVLENACWLRTRHCGAQDLYAAVRELLACADVVVVSLAKDFAVNKGGLIACNDAKLAQALRAAAERAGTALDAFDSKLIALALRDMRFLESRVTERMQAVHTVWQALARRGVPLVHPAGAHCVLIDVRRLAPFKDFACAVPSFLAWLYHATGIRAGAHSVGMQRREEVRSLVRLALPLGLAPGAADEIACRLDAAFETLADVPELAALPSARGAPGELGAEYTLLRYHAVRTSAPAAPRAAAVVALPAPVRAAPTSQDPTPAPQAAAQIVPADPGTARDGAPPGPSGEGDPSASGAGDAQDKAPGDDVRDGTPQIASRRTREIAIVGMAGRYPKARNVRELWQNLKQGRDCIDDLPRERYEQRLRYGPAHMYRGGFIDGVDRFDSVFFNIPPKDAERLDPQERLFAEVAWETLEDAGYHPEQLATDDPAQSVGVYVGAVWAMYQTLGVEEKKHGASHAPNSFLWSIANRVSYWMNFAGPSLTIDTACSSSLTALYLACEAIAAGECGSAIVGGVNLDLHQSKWEINWSGGALSKDGVCRSFGANANGYVAGEGVGALYVKPLDQALADGDHVYGVIRSIVVNHGGRTSGFVVPNPKAQTRLIKHALARAGLDAAAIGYVEAHGTGTELGDPLEIAALGNAFRDANVAPQSCAVGSLKSNIGHLEAAAGVASVSKVLLQMRHRQLVPSLHSAVLNEHIDFANSPFRVQQTLESWQAQGDASQPLRAGISSFGAGGSNAHLILESYQPAEDALAPDANETHVFPLSARNEQQLKDVAQRLQDWLARDGETLPPLRDIAFTLQVGRKGFEHRAAIVARTRADLRDRLRCVIAGKRHDAVATGNAKNGDPLLRLMNRGEREEVVGVLSRRGDALKLARLWVDGLLPDWRGVNGASRNGRRASLPTYPFADKRHWVPMGPGAESGAATLRGVHPLIDSNESTFERQVFKKSFHSGDFFIYDHLVMDVPTLPGVAYLELARKAGELAAGRPVRRLKNVLWVSPLAVKGDARTDAQIELKPAQDAVQLEVYSSGENGKKILHSQCKLAYATERELAQPDEYIDLAAIKARCAKALDGADAYPLFKSFGLNLGPSFRSLHEVYRGASETLGQLRLPASREGDLGALALHPALVDGALQAGVAAQLGGDSSEMLVPFSIGEVEILHPLPATCWSYVTEVKDERVENSRVSKKNVVIADDSGKVLVRIKEATGVPIAEVHKAPARTQDAAGFATLYYTPQWEAAPLGADGDADTGDVLLFDVDDALCAAYHAALAPQGGRVTLVRPGAAYSALDANTFEVDPAQVEHFAQLFAALTAQGALPRRIVFAWTRREALCEQGGAELQAQLTRSVYAVLHLCRALQDAKPDAKLPLVYLYTAADAELPEPQHEALAGFFRSLALEFPKIQGRTLELAADAPVDAVLGAVRAEFRADAADAVAVRHLAQTRQVRRLKALTPPAAAADAVPLRERGVYLITGGAGGLGLIFAEFLAKRCQARLLLTGRSPATPALETRLDALRGAGAEVVYVAADITRTADVADLIARCKTQFGALHGILHSAGVLRDSYVRNKTTAEMDAVLAPKVFGTLLLDQASADEPLDWFVLFSSMAAVGGNAGQSDYGYANHFMDTFAHRREQRRRAGTRSGKTLSLNWSLWADGGMKVDAQTEQLFTKTLGLKLLGTENGVQAFLDGLAADVPQLAVLEGIQEKIEIAWGLRKKPAAPAAPAAPSVATGDGAAADMPARVQAELTRIAMEFLKLDAADIGTDAVLLDLGFDSIGLTSYANEINARYGSDVTPVLFFDYPSISEVARYLCSERAADVARVHAASAVAAPVAEAAPATAAAAVPIQFNKGWNPTAAESAAAPLAPADRPSTRGRFADMPIAIVGMAGVMPQSDDLGEFWNHLAAGRDLISEIPRDRWNWEDYYGDPFKEVNKSNSKWGGFMKEVDKFDAPFFGISRREAIMMDPQQRIFLETVWKAIEDSGHRVSDLAGTRTGLFVGVATNDYVDLMNRRDVGLDGYSASGNSHSVLANRISFLLNLRGPSAPIDTACSSSLVALHRAIESIHTGSSEMAIVGGVQVMLSPAAYISFGMAGMLSNDGRCKTFDKRANGYVRGEGSGAILLKPLAAAEADGDHIYAVIRATAENHGGRVTTLTAPNSAAQSELLVEAYSKAAIDPATVGYIECHGTGTGLGDPIEIQALSKAFGELYKKHERAPAQTPHCGLSSAKTNIGHLETAAGVAGILRVLLALKHRRIPANVHFSELNPYINLSGSPFYIAAQTTDWAAPRAPDGSVAPRCAGVSSFGFGGANAHIVLQEFLPAPSPARAASAPQLIVLSAKTEDRLRAYAAAMLAHLDGEAVDFADFAYTLQVGRDEMAERLAFAARDVDATRATLRRWLDGDANALQRDTVRAAKKPAAAPAPSAQEIAALLERGDLDTLAQLWVRGAEIDWRRLPRAQAPRRLSVPTYPFARERYWFADGEPGLPAIAAAPRASAAPAPRVVERAAAPAIAAPAAAETPQTHFYQSAWADAPLASTASAPNGDILLLAADAVAAETFAHALRERGAAGRLCVALPGTGFRQPAPDRFEIEPTSRADHDAMFAALRAAGITPRHIVHAWSACADAFDANALEASLRLGVDSLLPLAQALNEARRAAPTDVQLIFVCDPQQPQHAAAASFGASLLLEQRRLAFKCIAHRAAAGLGTWLVDELCDTAPGAGEIECDGTQRRRQRWQHAPAPAASTESPLRERGCYVITGGAGGLGLIFAAHLAKQVRARLALIGRSALSAQQQAALAALARDGAEVAYLQADIADAAQTERALIEVRTRFGRIDGIVHAAGVIRHAPLERKTAADLRAVCAAKLAGTLNLDRASRNDDLDFFVAFSSLAAALGSAGQHEYAYANGFLDRFATLREALVAQGTRRGKTHALAWPLWRDGGMQPEQVLGIALDAKTKAMLQQSSGLYELDTAAGLAAFDACLRGADCRTLVVHGLRSKIDLALGIGVAPVTSAAPSTVRAATSSSAREHDRARLLRADLLRLVAQALLFDAARIASDTNLSEYGLDSIGAATLFRSVNETFGLELAPALLFEYPTLDAFGAYLLSEHAAVLDEHYAAQLGVARAAEPVAHVPQAQTPIAAPPPVAASAAIEVAIVGIAGQFPGADSPAALWQALLAGTDAIGDVPRERGWSDVGGGLQRRGGFLPDVAAFDAEFFGISAREAALMDPQQRLFLQVAWNAIEDAGHAPAEFAGSNTGVYVGMSGFDYAELLRETSLGAEAQAATGMAHCVLPNRVSYLLDLRGPSEAIDTACSSSLVAVHRAAQAIASGNCDMALAGGVNLLLTPSLQRALGSAGLLAADGRCKTFDERADGYVRSEGCAAVLLKRLDRAHADGDAIYGVIKGSGVNHGGRAMALTAPNPNAQAELIADVYARAGVELDAVGLIEAHGTGTPMGDAVEINGLKKAFRQLSERRGRALPAAHCAIGAIKTQIGHLEAASGVTALIAATLALRHRRIPGLLHFETLNPQIRLDDSPFYLATESRAWEPACDAQGAALPLTAGVSSFGFGGVNAHVVLQEHVSETRAQEPDARARQLACVFPLSAKTPAELERRARDLVAYLAEHATHADAARIAYTLQIGREAMPQRLGVVADSLPELQSKLQCWLDEIGVGGVYRGSKDAAAESLALIDRDREIKRTIAEKWLAQGDLGALLEFWTQGVDVDWTACYGAQPPARTNLPTYPFARVRHWIDTVQTPTSAAPRDVRVPQRAAPAGASRTSAAARDPFERLIREELAQQLKRAPEQLDGHKNLLELGANSLGIAALVREVNRRLDVRLSPSILFEHPTIARFAAYLRGICAPPAQANDTNLQDESETLATALDRTEPARRDAAAVPERATQLLQHILWRETEMDEEYERLTF